MSHFTVLVIGDDVARQLQPFHEFECTGENDEYVQDVDETEEFRKTYETGTVPRLRGPDGTLFATHEDQFYRDLTPEELKEIGLIGGTGFGSRNGKSYSYTSRDWGDGLGYRPKMWYIPEGFEEVEVPYKDVMTFLQFVDYEKGGLSLVKPGEDPDIHGQHKYGYVRVDENGEVLKIINRTNPNAKWDYWRVGGRWAGFFKPKAGVVVPVPERSWDSGEIEPNTADSLRKGDIDFEGMRTEARLKAEQEFDKLEIILNGKTFKTFGELEEEAKASGNVDWDAIRAKFWAQPVLPELKDAFSNSWNPGRLLEDYRMGREAYVLQQELSCASTFAVLKDGVWYEKGRMGWWATVSDAKDEMEWLREWWELVMNLSDDTLLTVVDCHI